MNNKNLFWPVFWLTHAIFTINWIISWSELSWIPNRVYWFFEVIPVTEVVILLVLAAVKRRLASGIIVGIVVQAFLYVHQLFFMGMYAGLGDNPSFFK